LDHYRYFYSIVYLAFKSMNERIEKLAEQAGFQYIKDEGIGWAGNYNASLPKFAELIVAECLEACSRANEIRHFVPPTQEQVVLSCMREIEHHFGVEE
jgi:hypothetical protein